MNLTTINHRQTELDSFIAEFFPLHEQRAEIRIPASAGSTLDDDALLDKARRAKNGAKFVALFDRGDLTEYEGDDSGADQALCNLLAFWTADRDRTDRLFRRSALMRDKWDQPARAGETFGEGTIRKAFESCAEFFGADSTPKTNAAESQATRIVRFADDAGAELFHDAEDTFVSINIDGHQETMPIESRATRMWLQKIFYANSKSAPNAQAVSDARALLSARARFEGPEHSVHLRTAWHGSAIYIDLADPDWRAVEVSAAGWRVVDDPPVRFRRPAGMRALPLPVPGDPMEIAAFINVTTPDECRLSLSWLVAALCPDGPYPIQILNGEQGAAKSFTARVLRHLIDPNKSEIRSEPRSVEDLMIAANNGWVLNFDNVSSLRPWLSDALCRIATGGGFSTRTLYENTEETIIDAQRPIILNGIEDFATRDDLLDRAIVQVLPPIPDAARRPEAEFWSSFDHAHPRLLGGILDALSCSLRNRDVRLDRLPRMADFALRAVAAAPSLNWTGERFIEIYTGNRAASTAASLESSPAAMAIVTFIEEVGEWIGPSSKLLKEINDRTEEKARPKGEWPGSPRGVTGLLQRYAPAIRRSGITAIQLPRQGRMRPWHLKVASATDTTVTSVTPEGAADDDHDDDDDPETQRRGHLLKHVQTINKQRAARGEPPILPIRPDAPNASP